MIAARASVSVGALAADDLACICGETATTPRPVCARDELSPSPFTYLRCASCGAERLLPRPAPEAIGAYYPSAYASDAARPDSCSARIKRLIYLAYYAPEKRFGRVLGPLLWFLLFPVRGHGGMAFEPPATRRVFVPARRRRHARRLALALLPFGWLAAACGHGDFVTVVARKALG